MSSAQRSLPSASETQGGRCHSTGWRQETAASQRIRYRRNGLRHTAGSYYRKDIIAAEDAEVVKSLKSVGAIPIGVTNVPELCMWWESHNTVYGRSRNPYDTRHITGGSSGGEAAVQGAAGSAFESGLTLPAPSVCPRYFAEFLVTSLPQALFRWGQQPDVKGRLIELLTTGPMARHAKDLRLIFGVLIGERVHKMNKIPKKAQLRILFMEDDGGSPLASPVDPEMKDALRKAVQHLEQTYGVKAQVSACNGLRTANLYWFFINCQVVLAVLKPTFQNCTQAWKFGVQAVSGAGGVPFCEELSLQKGKINPFWELVKFCFRISAHTLPAIMLGIIEKIAYVGNHLLRHKKLIEMGYSLAKEIQDVLKDDAVLLYPSFPSPAPRHYVPLFRPADFSYCAVFNVFGVPVTQVHSSRFQGFASGSTNCGGMHSDHITISVAEELERDGQPSIASEAWRPLGLWQRNPKT
ncbi:Fatty-acid amide hydrolase 2 [Orchesella cincta]|uniref:Fatty-acid amide hydrolase 2 n=1 Tax=Orchesella cincta TaxID=48709 RepID=A0A1D2M5E7_ORCCI|nr:Fatty-acid amide hydrolase 2 [Orchesella cincta]